MNGDGGLIALRISECELLLSWADAYRYASSKERDIGLALEARLREWRARHSEATP